MATLLEKSTVFSLKREKKSGKTSIIKDFPYKRMEGSFLIDKNNKYQTFLKISTQNVFSLSDEEQSKLMDSLTTLLRVYVDCLNIISMKFPPGLDKNVQFWQQKLLEGRNSGNMPQVISCQENLNKLYWVEKNLPELEFFLMVFGETKDELESNIKIVKRFSSEIETSNLSAQQVESIVYKLCNMNADI